MDKIRKILNNSRFKSVYLLINNYLYVYGENIEENIEFSNIGGALNE